MTDPNKYPKESTEHRILTVLNPFIQEMKERMYSPEFKNSPEFKSERVELETLGSIVSKFTEWDGNKIATVADAAFEDANYTSMEKYLEL